VPTSDPHGGTIRPAAPSFHERGDRRSGRTWVEGSRVGPGCSRTRDGGRQTICAVQSPAVTEIRTATRWSWERSTSGVRSQLAERGRRSMSLTFGRLPVVTRDRATLRGRRVGPSPNRARPESTTPGLRVRGRIGSPVFVDRSMMASAVSQRPNFHPLSFVCQYERLSRRSQGSRRSRLRTIGEPWLRERDGRRRSARAGDLPARWIATGRIARAIPSACSNRRSERRTRS
jgi:hypothetical protein